ncbi:hypothetical protein D3C81_1387360 [compost metagenome]
MPVTVIYRFEEINIDQDKCRREFIIPVLGDFLLQLLRQIMTVIASCQAVGDCHLHKLAVRLK